VGAIGPERHKQAEVASRTPDVMAREARKPFGWSHGWGAETWLQWAAVTEMLHRLGIAPPATILDVGCGPGWTSAFLAEAGHPVTGVDLVPANVEVARERARRWDVDARFEVGDMDHLDLDNTWDAALLLDALHHSTRQADVLAGIARHLRPGGWLLLGEPSVLHRVSPHARHTSREAGWTERGISVRTLRRDLRAAGFGATRRFYGATRPYERRWRGLLGQAARLVGANLASAPQMHVWLAAQRRAR
jgi:2-polyprenyl-3-methyl-5-hydroxy-6-metoxy-1,4-benzoquinol methylase